MIESDVLWHAAIKYHHIGTGGEPSLGAAYFCFHTCIVDRTARKISLFARNDSARESNVSQSLSHQSPATSHSFFIACWISSSDFTSTEEMSFLNFSSCSAMSGASGGNWGSIFFNACSVICETT